MKILVLLALLCASTIARADNAPWETGVPAEQQARANAIFAEGNELFTRLAHAAALEKYKAAIALWDHPMIRFNMAVTLIRLDRVVEAADELERALRFGEAPFTPDLYEQARNYQLLLKNQLGELRVICETPETKVMLDGKPWFDGPATKTLRVPTGEHTVVAERKGYLTRSTTLVVPGGKTLDHRIELVPIESALVERYRHPRWAPWALAASGAAVAIGGLTFSLVGRRDMDTFARHFVAACPTGCEANLAMHPELAEELADARLKGRIGATLMVAGGAITAAGIVWVFLNRPTRTLPVEVNVSSGEATASMRWRW
jgi:hypothetical protein